MSSVDMGWGHSGLETTRLTVNLKELELIMKKDHGGHKFYLHLQSLNRFLPLDFRSWVCNYEKWALSELFVQGLRLSASML